MTLRDRLTTVAADLEDITAAPAADGTGVAWSHGTEVFAALVPDGGVEFHLDPAIAAAAIRTPDTEPSPRGPGWVRFRPATLDGHAVDRATAWFISAYRRTTRS